MKELTEAEQALIKFAKNTNSKCLTMNDCEELLEIGNKLIAERKPKPVFPVDGAIVASEGKVFNYVNSHKRAKQGNTFYTAAEAEKEALRRAARARCIEKIADCGDDNSSFYFKPAIWTSYGVAFKHSERPPVESKMVCKNRKRAEKLAKDKQFCADYKLYLGVSDE